jgi:serine/threonine-protein kinase
MTTPRLLGSRYEIGETLGYGGMAEVHRGRDVRLGREVAVKVLRADLARDPSFQARFRREAQAAASLNHPAIVAVYDTGEETGSQPYIVMEYVEGRTLRDVLKAEGRLMPRRAMEIVADVCAALDFSHRNGIVHRDVKPGNVMITRGGAVKVMDFGIARAVADNAATVTQTAAVIGTAQYLSPEQARGENVDARSDVYSTGVLLFELITGTPPFTGDSPVAVAYQHVRENPPPPSTINPDVPRELDAIVLKAMAKNPANRYQSAGEMRADLIRAMSGRPVVAEPVMLDDEVTTVLGGGPGGGTGMYPATAGYPGGPNGARPGQQPQRRRWGWIAAGIVAVLLVGIGAYALSRFLTSENPEVAVPRLTNLTEAQAKSQLSAAGLTGDFSVTASEAEKKGRVVDQDPDPGFQLKKGDTVRVSIGGGPATIQLPDVRNQTFDDAARTLREAKLQVVRQDVNNGATTGLVVNTNPRPGAQVNEGARITLQVSNGRTPLPDVTGKTDAEATATLNDAGWTKIQRVTQVPDRDFEPGEVFRTDPTAGAAVPKDQTITLYIAKAKPTPTPTPTTPSPTPTMPSPTVSPSSSPASP